MPHPRPSGLENGSSLDRTRASASPNTASGPGAAGPPYSGTSDGPTSAAVVPPNTLPPPQPTVSTAAQTNGNNGHVSPPHNSNVTASPTSAHSNSRAGMSIRDMVSGDARTPDIDSAMKARLGQLKR